VTQDGDPKASATIAVGIVGVLLLLAILLFTVALFYDVQRAQDAQKLYARPYPEITALRGEQLEKLYGPPRWVSESQGVVAIPIDRAIALAVRDLKSAAPPTTMTHTGPAVTRPAEREP